MVAKSNNPGGFALPTVLVASMIMLVVLLASVVSTAAVRVALAAQYYGQIAQSASDAGVAYANACLAASNGVAKWGDGTPYQAGGPLMPGTDCSGNMISGLTCNTSPNDSDCLVLPNGAPAQVLVVGGGGGGGGSYYGGGGGGGQSISTTKNLSNGTISVTVGQGGAGGTGSDGTGTPGSNGANSAQGSISAAGGGGGGGMGTHINGYDGGNGGGGSTNGGAGGNGASGGFNGGSVVCGWAGAGGGGAGANGSGCTDNNGGAGGVGVSSSISGSAVWYSGGGGGGARTTGGGGGNGGGAAGKGSSSSVTANAGSVNTGGGGGGGSYGNGGAGGSGIVIISYANGAMSISGCDSSVVGATNTVCKVTAVGTKNLTVSSVVTATNMVSTFSVGAPTVGADGKVQSYSSIGKVNLLRASTQTAWRTYAKSTVEQTSFKGVVTNGLVMNLDAGNTGSYSTSAPTAWTDLTGNSNSGTLGSSSWYSGADKGVITFDGTLSHYVDVGFLGNLYNQGTISFWMKTSATLADYLSPFTTNFNGGIATNAAIRFSTNASGVLYLVIGQDDGTSTTTNYLSSGLAASTWYNVVLVWDKPNDNITGYLNNAIKFDHTSQTFWPSALPDVTIGDGYDDTVGRIWSGSISAVQMYNRALSPGEVNQNYSAFAGRYFNSAY